MWSSESIWDSLSRWTLNKSFQAASFINFSPVCGLQMIRQELNSLQTFNDMSHGHSPTTHTFTNASGVDNKKNKCLRCRANQITYYCYHDSTSSASITFHELCWIVITVPGWRACNIRGEGIWFLLFIFFPAKSVFVCDDGTVPAKHFLLMERFSR